MSIERVRRITVRATLRMRTALVVLLHIAAHAPQRAHTRLPIRTRDLSRGYERSTRGSVIRRATSTDENELYSRLEAIHTDGRESSAHHESRTEMLQIWCVHSGYPLRAYVPHRGRRSDNAARIVSDITGSRSTRKRGATSQTSW